MLLNWLHCSKEDRQMKKGINLSEWVLTPTLNKIGIPNKIGSQL